MTYSATIPTTASTAAATTGSSLLKHHTNHQNLLQRTYSLKNILIIFAMFSLFCFMTHQIAVNQLKREHEIELNKRNTGGTTTQTTVVPALSFPIEQCKLRKTYVGNKVYGGWMICPIGLNSKSIVYSFGIGENVEFDQKMIQKFNLEKLYAFDPTPKSIHYVQTQQEVGLLDRNRFQLFPVALVGDATQTEMKMFLPKNSKFVSGSVIKSSNSDHLDEGNYVMVKAMDLPRIMKMLNHDHIDLLKLDIEGAEFDVFKALLSNGSFTYCNQVLVEQHARFFDPKVGKQKLEEMNQLLIGNGFILIHVEKDEEYTYVRERI